MYFFTRHINVFWLFGPQHIRMYFWLFELITLILTTLNPQLHWYLYFWLSAIYIVDWGKVNRAMHSDHQRSPHQGPIVWAWSAEYMTLIWGVWAQVHDIDIWRFSAQDDIIDIEGSAWHDYIDVRALRRLHRYRGVSWPDYIDICTFQ